MGGWSVMWSHCNLTHWDWIGWFWVKYTNFYKSNQITSRLSAGYFLKIHSVQPHLYSKQCGRLCTEKLFKQWLLQCCRVNVSSGDHTCSLTAALVSTESQGYKEVGYRAWNIITAYVLIHWWVNDYESVHLKHNKIVTYYPIATLWMRKLNWASFSWLVRCRRGGVRVWWRKPSSDQVKFTESVTPVIDSQLMWTHLRVHKLGVAGYSSFLE